MKRRSDEKRPLLLLGHSLGGLLIKQALINACNNEKYQQIKLATKGLVFFATPHRGGNGSWVSLGYLAAKITSRGDTILQALDKGSMFTDLLHEHCRHRLLDFDIVSFWGTLDHIVSKESASLGLPGNRENVVSLDADHSSICKFGVSVTDKDNLETVLGNIQDLAENALKIDELSSLGGLAIFQGCTLRVPHQLDSPSARDSGLMDRVGRRVANLRLEDASHTLPPRIIRSISTVPAWANIISLTKQEQALTLRTLSFLRTWSWKDSQGLLRT